MLGQGRSHSHDLLEEFADEEEHHLFGLVAFFELSDVLLQLAPKQLLEGYVVAVHHNSAQHVEERRMLQELDISAVVSDDVEDVVDQLLFVVPFDRIALAEVLGEVLDVALQELQEALAHVICCFGAAHRLHVVLYQHTREHQRIEFFHLALHWQLQVPEQHSDATALYKPLPPFRGKRLSTLDDLQEVQTVVDVPREDLLEWAVQSLQ